jgi:hypothetical protein
MNASRTARPQQPAPRQVVVPGTSARMPGLNRPQQQRPAPAANGSGDRRQLSLW